LPNRSEGSPLEGRGALESWAHEALRPARTLGYP